MREFDMNKILAITPNIDYIAHRISLSYVKFVIRGIEDPKCEDLKFRYEDAFFSVKCEFEKEFKELNMVKL